MESEDAIVNCLPSWKHMWNDYIHDAILFPEDFKMIKKKKLKCCLWNIFTVASSGAVWVLCNELNKKILQEN